MEELIEILKFSVSGVLVLVCAYFMLKKITEQDDKRMRHQTRIESGKILTPLRLTAYERLTLFLERIKPESMIIRIQSGCATAQQLHLEYLAQVREEFEHNVSQQIYVSEDLWRFITAAKENLIQFVNNISVRVPQNVAAIELSKIILEEYNRAESSPIDVALNVLKKEVQRQG